MELKKTADKVIINGIEKSLHQTLEELASKDSAELAGIFENYKLGVPRVVNMVALRKVINPYIVRAKEMHLSDEMLYRLRTYPNFSEYQLQNLYKLVCDEANDFFQYKMFFFELLLRNSNKLHLTDNIWEEILKLNNGQEDFSKYQNNLHKLLFDYNRQFDGLTTNSLLDNLPKNATANDIREIGGKYNLTIPKRLKKEEMQAIIEKELKKQRKLDEQTREKIESLPIINLQRFAKDNNIKVSVDLKKEDLIAYLLGEVDKAHFTTCAYIPLDLEINDNFVFDLAYVMNEEIEEVVTPVANTVNEVVEEPKVIETIREVPVYKTDNQISKEEVERLVDERINNKFNAERDLKMAEIIANKITAATTEIAKEIINVLNSKQTEKEKEVVIKPLQPIVNVYSNEKVEEKVEEEAICEDKIYPYDNFTEQKNPLYDNELATRISIVDKKAIEPQYEESKDEVEAITSTPTLAEIKATKKRELKAAKKERKAFIREQEKKRQESLKAEKKQRKIDLKTRKLNDAKLKKALRTGKVADLDKEYFDQQLRLKEYEMLCRQEKESRRERRNSIIGRIFKTILLVIVLIVIAWAAFVVLFAFDKAAGAKNFFVENGFYDQLFAKAVEWVKSLMSSK